MNRRRSCQVLASRFGVKLGEVDLILYNGGPRRLVLAFQAVMEALCVPVRLRKGGPCYRIVLTNPSMSRLALSAKSPCWSCIQRSVWRLEESELIGENKAGHRSMNTTTPATLRR